jgi:hypothetical protein
LGCDGKGSGLVKEYMARSTPNNEFHTLALFGFCFVLLASPSPNWMNRPGPPASSTISDSLPVRESTQVAIDCSLCC